MEKLFGIVKKNKVIIYNGKLIIRFNIQINPKGLFGGQVKNEY